MGNVARPDEPCTMADLEKARAEWERDFQKELARLRNRVAELEEQSRDNARRQICGLTTQIASLERNVLKRDVTIVDVKKAGLAALGVTDNEG